MSVLSMRVQFCGVGREGGGVPVLNVHSVLTPFTTCISLCILHTVLFVFPKMPTKSTLLLVIISFILVTLLCDLGVILYGEIRC